MIKLFAVLPILPLLAACTAVPEETAGCDAGPAQSRLGQTYTEALGEELRSLTGAAILRAHHMGDPVTMDFRPDRLDVSWDDSRRIVRIACG